MRNNIVRAGVAALCIVALTGHQPVCAAENRQATQADAAKPDDKPVALALTAKVGDPVQYKSKVTLSFGGNEVTLEQNRKNAVKQIKDNGDIVVVVTDLGGKFTANGTDNEIPAGASVTTIVDKYNKILTFKPEKEDNPYLSTATLHLLAMVDKIIFPDKAVKAGDSWTTEIDNPAVKDKKVTLKTTFVGMEKADGADAWKIKQTLEADTDGGKMTADVTALLDAANGQLIQAEQTVKGVPGNMGAVDWKGKIQRVKPDADKADKTEKKVEKP